MRNPRWQRDELILALNLYFNLSPGQIHAKNPKIVELSNLLNLFPFHNETSQLSTYRNPNGVSLKLSNFLFLDEKYSGKGMSYVSKQDKALFEEFKNNKHYLHKIAESIKSLLKNEVIRKELEKINIDEDDENSISKFEGNQLYRYHLYRERNSSIVKKKKRVTLNKYGKLECELCKFDFAKIYGTPGIGFIECHHKTPLHLLNEKTETKLTDLMLVCANCHRMLHRGWVKF